ncbi:MULTISPECIES: protein TolR [unclassified Agarivorans]|uniref:protein TolR n=1 Tax=unclassified Agarivorans TaxID=2636026 RepID=UPI0010D296D8|nr:MULTISPECIES: protein TolR [unclassified Agarivorans]MDO6685061.1 protein TolR [Agarivorans sp. 3_MG-2023]MDO6717381.1 protein TolR [Agarivorans sp. 2_MG-2023]MDO6765290.1 protein TolR [Agarivorans sp. 1_MG-2023]GDY27395.1 protein TolR [Agarivorans sp. Toyoura001]
MNHYQRPKRRLVAEINVVPYIDVMLVLLIIFMVTAPLITQGVKVDLPQASAEAMPEDSKPPLVATVDESGQYFLDTGDNSDSAKQSVSGDDLQALVIAHLQLDPDLPVVVRGDKNVRYEQIINLMVLLQSAGVPSVGLMTQPDNN